MRFNLMIICAFIFMLACTKEKFQNDGPIYFNSFENKKDLLAFKGYAYSLSSDVFIKAGDSCLMISGGCVWPHAYFFLPVENAMKVTMSALVKSESNCGVISISSVKTGQEIILSTSSGEWVLRESTKTLDVMDFDTINVSFISGGLIACTSYIDLLTIKKVE